MNPALAGECGLATNYHNLSHPSLPNYVGATSGLAVSSLTPFDPDCNPTGSCLSSAPSIFGQGESWKAYEESMPSNCAGSNSGEYAVRHNPPPYFTSLSGCGTLEGGLISTAVDYHRFTRSAAWASASASRSSSTRRRPADPVERLPDPLPAPPAGLPVPDLTAGTYQPAGRCGDDPPAGTASHKEVTSMRLGKEQAAGYVEDVETAPAAEIINSDTERMPVTPEPQPAVAAG